MYGNGVMTGMMKIIIRTRRRLIRKDLRLRHLSPALCAEAAGNTLRVTAECRFETSTIQTATSTMAASVSC